MRYGRHIPQEHSDEFCPPHSDEPLLAILLIELMRRLYQLTVNVQPVPPTNVAVVLWLVDAVNLVPARHKVMTDGEVFPSQHR